MGKLGMGEILLVLAIVLIVFGVGKLPQAMGQLGKGIHNFKKGAAGDDVGDEKSASKKEKVADKDTDSKNAAS
jgi:sec-independent protein translocase protein TatA